MMCGGIGDERDADADVQSIIETPSVKSDAESKSGKTFIMYQAVSYKSQVVAGTNYFVKVNIGKGEFVHMRVFKPLPHENSEPSLHSLQADKAESDAIEYF